MSYMRNIYLRFSDIDNFVGQFLLDFIVTYSNLDRVVIILNNKL